MRNREGQGRGKGPSWLLAVLGVPGLLMLGCGRSTTVDAGAPPRPETSAPAGPERPRGPLSTFQGEVADVDPPAGELVLDVHIVWVPLAKTEPHQRVVVVDSKTRWDPAPGGIGQLRRGEVIQVEAEDATDGTWRAMKVQLLDID